MSKDSNIKNVLAYYKATQSSYNILWMNKRNLAMHYGIRDYNVKSFHDALINENKIVADNLEIEKGDSILDAGCGVGGTAIWIAEEYGARVTGISIVQDQVAAAKKYALDRGVSSLTDFFKQDFCNTLFEDKEFDKVIAIESMCHSESKEAFVSEVSRLLKDDGKIAIADYLIDKDLSNEERELYNIFCSGWAMPNLLTVESCKTLLEEKGFKNVKIINKTSGALLSARRMYLIGLLSFPFDFILNKIGLVPDYILLNTRACFSQYNLLKKNKLKLCIISADK